MEADVEALLMSRRRPSERSWCHRRVLRLAGRIRLYWRGFDGGSEARQSIAEFLDAVRSRARLLPGER